MVLSNSYIWQSMKSLAQQQQHRLMILRVAIYSKIKLKASVGYNNKILLP